jgi:hypothetical protein
VDLLCPFENLSSVCDLAQKAETESERARQKSRLGLCNCYVSYNVQTGSCDGYSVPAIARYIHVVVLSLFITLG